MAQIACYKFKLYILLTYMTLIVQVFTPRIKCTWATYIDVLLSPLTLETQSTEGGSFDVLKLVQAISERRAECTW